MNLSILNSLCYTVGWFWCVLCGIHGHLFAASVGAFFLIFIQLYYTKLKNLGLYIQDLLLVIFSVPLGALLETFFIQIDIIHYSSTKNFPPIWIIFLYPLFSLLLNHSLKIIKKNYTFPLLLGFSGAPLTYIAGNSFGVLTFPHPLFLTWIILGISWALFLSLLAKIAKIVERGTKETFQDRDSQLTVELLYDGDCPICEREICTLRQLGRQANIEFINIASKDFSPAKHNNIEYERAMSQIHAIDSNGNRLIGLPAFAVIYARCQLLVISTLLRIPFITTVLNPLYRLFAKKRLWITGRMPQKLKK